MKTLCIFIAFIGLALFVLCVICLFLKAWMAAALCYATGSILSFCLGYLDKRFHPRGIPA